MYFFILEKTRLVEEIREWFWFFWSSCVMNGIRSRLVASMHHDITKNLPQKKTFNVTVAWDFFVCSYNPVWGTMKGFLIFLICFCAFLILYAYSENTLKEYNFIRRMRQKVFSALEYYCDFRMILLLRCRNCWSIHVEYALRI